MSHESDEIHLPSPTIWPFVLGGGISLAAFGVATSLAFSVLGIVLIGWGLWGWIRELVYD